MAKTNRLRRLTKRGLRHIDNHLLSDQSAFNKWLSSISKSKHSQQDDLPSSQILPKMSQISPNTPQLFVVLDTCSICSYRAQLIHLVIRLKKLFPKRGSPIKILISLVVLEELDKCNRRSKSGGNNNKKNLVKVEDVNNQDSNLQDVLEAMKPRDPPRCFMRFIEEEMRTGEVLISELDPFKKTSLGERGQNLEIITHDDRILECCLRTESFIKTIPHHPDTKVILVTEDNLFKSKATTFNIISYRWMEFETKFKNFGLNNYVSTPQVPSILAAATAAVVAAAPVARLKARKSPKKGLVGAMRQPKRRAPDDAVEIVGEVIMID